MRWSAHPGFAEAFVAYVREEPTALMFHEKLRRDLLERFPLAQWEIWALCAALEEGIFLDLTGAQAILSEDIERDLQWVLCQRLSLREELAQWTVRTLARGFGKEHPTTPIAESALQPPPVPFLPDASRLSAGRAPSNATPTVRVDEGTYQLGDDGPAFDSDALAATRGIIPPYVSRSVELTSAFHIGVFTVTNGYWQHVIGRRHTETGLGGDDHPVTGVTFFDAIAFCNAASAKEGLDPVYRVEGDKIEWSNREANGFRLPTEAEWEIACRAGSRSMFGNVETLTSEHANYDGQFEGGIYRATTTPVGSFQPNAWGLYDMHGNVHEWCWDWSSPSPPGDATDPRGPVTGSYRIVRGGAWTVWRAEHCASATRMAFRPDMPGFDCGFRMVRNSAD